MDLIGRAGPPIATLLGAALLATAGCGGDTPFSYGDDAVELPATAKEALRLADVFAKEWSPRAYVAQLGGGFAVMDAQGRSRNHTYAFYSRDGSVSRKLVVQLIGGVPFGAPSIVTVPDPPFVNLDGMIDSDVAVAFARNEAELWNVLNPGEAVPLTEHYAARLESVPVWPERETPDDVPTDVAWRVDFVELGEFGDPPSSVWFTVGRFYLDPIDGSLLGDPVVPATGRELYPNL